MSDPQADLPIPDPAPPAPPTLVVPVPTTIAVPEGLYRRCDTMRHEMLEKLSHYNSQKESTKAAKEDFDTASSASARAWDALVRAEQGDDLPLFNQSDANADAVSRPEVQNLVDELNFENVADGITKKWDPLVVAGYTDDERRQAHAWITANRLARKLDETRRAEGDKTPTDFPQLPEFMKLAPGAVDEDEAADVPAGADTPPATT